MSLHERSLAIEESQRFSWKLEEFMIAFKMKVEKSECLGIMLRTCLMEPTHRKVGSTLIMLPAKSG